MCRCVHIEKNNDNIVRQFVRKKCMHAVRAYECVRRITMQPKTQFAPPSTCSSFTCPATLPIPIPCSHPKTTPSNRSTPSYDTAPLQAIPSSSILCNRINISSVGESVFESHGRVLVLVPRPGPMLVFTLVLVLAFVSKLVLVLVLALAFVSTILLNSPNTRTTKAIVSTVHSS
jgi:hypothetical protein